MARIASMIKDGVISEPARSSQVSVAFDQGLPKIKSYVDAATDYFVVKPSSSFTLAAPDEYVRWNTTWGAAPSSCKLSQSMGHLSSLYGFDDRTTWSPSCYDLNCPKPGETYGSVAQPWLGPTNN